MVSSKAVTEVLDMKDRSEIKHDFTNRSCLHCGVLKALHSFQEKIIAQVKGYAIFS